MTLVELRDRTAEWFAGLGIESAKLDAEVLIGHALGIQRLHFITDGTRPLSDDELSACRELVRRRGKREPVAYILGSREFYSRDFAVDRRVLIPRPETEHLVELAARWLTDGRPAGEVISELDDDADDEPVEEMGAYVPGVETEVVYDEGAADDDEGEVRVELDPDVAAAQSGDGPTPGDAARGSDDDGANAAPHSAGVVLDYGTGSGAIAITLATEVDGLRVLAVDVSSEALEVAKANAASHGVDDRVGFVPSDGLSRVPARFRGSLRAIVANPPYVPEDTRETLMPDVRDWEPEGALFCGPDALLHYRRLAAEARDWLAADGFVAMEVGAGQASEVAELLRGAGWHSVEVRRDLAGIPRVVAAWRNPA